MKNFEVKKILDNDKILEIINRLDFFSEFSNSERLKISRFYNYITIYKKNSCIIKELEQGSSFHIMLCGKAAVTKELNEKEINILEPGDIFGEISFLTNSRRTANIVAKEDTITIEFDNEFLETLGPSTREKIKDKLLLNLVSRIHQLNNALVSKDKTNQT